MPQWPVCLMYHQHTVYVSWKLRWWDSAYSYIDFHESPFSALPGKHSMASPSSGSCGSGLPSVKTNEPLIDVFCIREPACSYAHHWNIKHHLQRRLIWYWHVISRVDKDFAGFFKVVGLMCERGDFTFFPPFSLLAAEPTSIQEKYMSNQIVFHADQRG